MSLELQTDRLHQENVIFSSRLNLLLVGESMLLVSYVSALNLDDTTKSWITFILSILGFFITSVFWLIIIDHARYILKLNKKIKEAFPDVGILNENPVGAITIYLSYMIPTIFLIIWGVLIYMSRMVL